MSTEFPPIRLKLLNNQFVDGENNTIRVDIAYSVKGNSLPDTIDEIIKVHGPRIYLLPLSGASGGGGVFKVDSPGDGIVVGLHITPVHAPRVRQAADVDIKAVCLDEIIIDERRGEVYAGAAITLEQLNGAVAEELGPQYKVLGADLTSYTYAQVGATFMTGGMGPQRRYFSDSVNQIALHNGSRIVGIDEASLYPYAGTYGWTGLVSAVRCRFHQLPMNEVAFAIPVSNTPDGLARLLQHFCRFTFLQLRDRQVASSGNSSDLVLGLEHVTASSMQPLLSQGGDDPITRRAAQLAEKSRSADSDGLIFVSGYSNRSVDDFLMELVDHPDAEEFTIAGINLEHTEVFTEPDQMRAVREAIPYAARTQAPDGRFVFKSHTDANIQIDPGRVEQTMIQLWQVNQAYVEAVQRYFINTGGVSGEILVYGHLNPVGVDPHNRITFACDRKSQFKKACTDVHELTYRFYRELDGICKSTGAVFVGGEKGAGSESEIFAAFDNLDHAPAQLVEKYRRQHDVIQNASPMFSWRALTPYRD